MPKLRLPAGACDSHAHLFGPQSQFPYVPKAGYIPPDATADTYIRVLKHLGVSRAVLVQPGPYGTDHAAVLAALAARKFPFRGVAVLSPDATAAEIEKLHAAGFRGVRISSMFKSTAQALDFAPTLAALIKPFGWHIQMFISVDKVPDLEQRLSGLPVNVVLDHLGAFDCAAGVNGAGFTQLLRLMKHENIWVKLSGVYHVSKKPPLAPDAIPFVQRMVETSNDRLVWATDWPHPTAAWIPDDGDLVDMLEQWVPDENTRRRILVDNAARLYDFS